MTFADDDEFNVNNDEDDDNDDNDSYNVEYDADRTYQIATSRLEYMYGNHHKNRNTRSTKITKTDMQNLELSALNTAGRLKRDDDDEAFGNESGTAADINDEKDDNTNNNENTLYFRSPWLHYSARSNRRDKRLKKLETKQEKRRLQGKDNSLTKSTTVSSSMKGGKKRRSCAVDGYDVEVLVDQYQQMFEATNDEKDKSSYDDVAKDRQEQKLIENKLFTQLRINDHLKYLEHLKIRDAWKRRRVQFVPNKEAFTKTVARAKFALEQNNEIRGANKTTNEENDDAILDQLVFESIPDADGSNSNDYEENVSASDELATIKHVMSMKKILDNEWKQIISGTSTSTDRDEDYDKIEDQVDLIQARKIDHDDDDDDECNEKDDDYMDDNNKDEDYVDDNDMNEIDYDDDNVTNFEDVENLIASQLSQGIVRDTNAHNTRQYAELILEQDHWTKLLNMNYVDRGLTRRPSASISKRSRLFRRYQDRAIKQSSKSNVNTTNKKGTIQKRVNAKVTNCASTLHYDVNNPPHHRYDRSNKVSYTGIQRIQRDLLRWQQHRYVNKRKELSQEHYSVVASKRTRIDGITVKFFPPQRTNTMIDTLHPQYFPLSSKATFNRLAHIRNIIKLAACQLYTNSLLSSLSTQQESNIIMSGCDRIIHLLWNESFMSVQTEIGKPIHAKITYNDRILKLSSDYGLQLYTYCVHDWQNKEKASCELDIAYYSLIARVSLPNYNIDMGLRQFVPFVVQRLARPENGSKEYNQINWMPKENTSLTNKIDSRGHSTSTATMNPFLEDLQDYFTSSRRKDLFLLPQVVKYDYIAGCVPPVPEVHLPLDVTGIVFGPQHPFCAVSYHYRISPTILTITTSSIVNKLMNTSDGSIHKILQNQLWVLLKTAIDLNRIDFYKFQVVDKVPLYQLYRTIMDCYSLACSGLLYVEGDSTYDGVVGDLDNDEYNITTRNYGSDSESDHDDHFKETKKNIGDDADSLQRMYCSIKNLTESLSDVLRHNGLGLFVNIHCVSSILKVASILPLSSATIILQPIGSDNIYGRNVFIVLKDVLTNLEETGSIVESLKDSTNNAGHLVEVGTLEYNIHEIVQDFARCVELDPSDLDSICWYVGTLTFCLIIVSGNRVGSGAHCFPSMYQPRSMDDVLFGRFKSDGNEYAAHEIRSCLPQFQEIRIETLKAFKLLLHIGTTQATEPRVNRAIASFLEWNEAMALLIGPIFDEEYETLIYNILLDLHKFHVNSWIFKERMTSCRELTQCNHAVEYNTRIHGLASILENDPNVQIHWMNLVQALGSFAVAGKTCYIGDHTSYDAWWGHDRCKWWNQHLLRSPAIESAFPWKVHMEKSKVLMILSKVFSEIEILDPIVVEASSNGTVVNDARYDWIDDAIERASYHDSQHIPTLSERELTIDECLPSTLCESRIIDEGKVHNTFERYASLDLIGTNSELYQLICYKTLIFSHLNKESFHPYVERVVVWILQQECNFSEKSRSNKFIVGDSTSIRCLSWLYQMGVDVLKIIRASAAFA